MNLLRRLVFSYWYFRKPPWDSGITPPELFEFIQTHPSGRAIDLGCGTGTNLITLAKIGWQVTGIDFAPRAIQIARKKLKAQNLQAQLMVGDVTNFNTGTPFELALDIGCFHGVHDRKGYLNQLERILAPGGFWLMYGFFRNEKESARPGLAESDMELIASRPLTLVSRRDGTDNRGRHSTWFLYQKITPKP